MGIHDRDYCRKSSGGAGSALGFLQTAVGSLLLANVVCWFVQVAGGRGVTVFLSASASEVLDLQLWKLVTANFAHDDTGAWHLVGNMFFLFLLGRELEQIYGRRDFYILYLVSGVLAVLAEVTLLQFTGQSHVRVLGASGAVMAVVVLFTLFYPHRTILFMFFIPAPVWLLCVLFIAQDLFGVLSQSASGVANLAHLTGALMGFLYRTFDLRWVRLRSLLQPGVSPRRRQPRGEVVPMRPRRETAAITPRSERDSVSRRIDDLLAKIASSGKDSLTEEEWEFLKENSSRYRSE